MVGGGAGEGRAQAVSMQEVPLEFRRGREPQGRRGRETHSAWGFWKTLAIVYRHACEHVCSWMYPYTSVLGSGETQAERVRVEAERQEEENTNEDSCVGQKPRESTNTNFKKKEQNMKHF